MPNAGRPSSLFRTNQVARVLVATRTPGLAILNRALNPGDGAQFRPRSVVYPTNGPTHDRIPRSAKKPRPPRTWPTRRPPGWYVRNRREHREGPSRRIDETSVLSRRFKDPEGVFTPSTAKRAIDIDPRRATSTPTRRRRSCSRTRDGQDPGAAIRNARSTAWIHVIRRCRADLHRIRPLPDDAPAPATNGSP